MRDRARHFSILAILLLASGCSMVGQSSKSDVGEKKSWMNPMAAYKNASRSDSFGKSGDSNENGLNNIWAMARLSERRGQPDNAREVYESMIERKPDDPRPYHRLAVMNAQESKWDEAKTYFERALALNPSDAELLGDAGYFHYLRADSQQAEVLLRRALEIDPSNAKNSNNLAILMGEQGRDEDCLAMFRRNGSEADALNNYGFVLSQRGEFNRAVQSYSQALTLDESLQPAAEAMVELARYIPEDERLTAYLPAQRNKSSLDTRLTRIDTPHTNPMSPVQNLPAMAAVATQRTNTESRTTESYEPPRGGPEVYDVVPTDYVSMPPANDLDNNASLLLRQYPHTMDAQGNSYGQCQPAMPQFPVQTTSFASPSPQDAPTTTPPLLLRR